MTLVVALSNNDQCIQVSDRRLTDAHGDPCVLPENKATIVSLADARFLCGFAGLARAGRFRTGQWIVDALLEAAQKDHLALGTLERFRHAATEKFQTPQLSAVPQQHRRLSVLLTGYRDVLPPPNLIAALITNFQNFESGQDEEPWDEFRATYWSLKPDTPPSEIAYVQRIGNWAPMTADDVAVLKRALQERRNASALVEMAVGLVRSIAARPAAAGTIGKDVSSVVLPSARPADLEAGTFPIYGGYHPVGASHRWHGVHQVISLPNVGLALMDPMVAAADASSTLPLAVQKVGRNKECPCGSGKKYKRCHGA